MHFMQSHILRSLESAVLPNSEQSKEELEVMSAYNPEETMSLVTRNPAFRIFDQDLLKPVCAATETS